MNKKTRLLIVIFLGVFGVHKFIDKDYKMGLIYLFTGGLCGIGWIIDIIKELIGKNTNSKSLMSTETLNMIKNGQLPTIIGTNINLANDEVCHYADIGYTFKDKTITTGYTGKSSGISIRLMKGLTYRTFDKITSVTEVNDGIILQIGSTSYSIILNTHTEFVKIFNMVKNNQ